VISYAFSVHLSLINRVLTTGQPGVNECLKKLTAVPKTRGLLP